MFYLSLLLACEACSYDIPIKNDDPDPEETQTESQTDTDDLTDDNTDGVVDPDCGLIEVEPNNSPEDAFVVPMETWICSTFNNYAASDTGEILVDFDVYKFQFPESGWLQVWVRAADIGSTANPNFTLQSSINNTFSVAVVTDSPGSYDPYLLSYIPAGQELQIMIQEESNTFGSDQFYRVLFSHEKSPIEYSKIEAETEDASASNNYLSDAEVIQSGDRILATSEDVGANDWYVIEADEGCWSLTIDYGGREFGSPLYTSNTEVSVFPPTIYDDSTVSKLTDNDNDSTIVSTYLSGPGNFPILAKSTAGGYFHWYFMDILLEESDSINCSE